MRNPNHWPRHLITKVVDHMQEITRVVIPRSWMVISIISFGTRKVQNGLVSPCTASFSTPLAPWLETSAIQIARSGTERFFKWAYRCSQKGSNNSWRRLILYFYWYGMLNTFGEPFPCTPMTVTALSGMEWASSSGMYCLMASCRTASWRPLTLWGCSRICWPAIVCSTILKESIIDLVLIKSGMGNRSRQFFLKKLGLLTGANSRCRDLRN